MIPADPPRPPPPVMPLPCSLVAEVAEPGEVTLRLVQRAPAKLKRRVVLVEVTP